MMIVNDRIYLRHVESDQANDNAVREKLKENDGAEDILNLSRKTASQRNF